MTRGQSAGTATVCLSPTRPSSRRRSPRWPHTSTAKACGSVFVRSIPQPIPSVSPPAHTHTHWHPEALCPRAAVRSPHPHRCTGFQPMPPPNGLQTRTSGTRPAPRPLAPGATRKWTQTRSHGGGSTLYVAFLHPPALALAPQHVPLSLAPALMEWGGGPVQGGWKCAPPVALAAKCPRSHTGACPSSRVAQAVRAPALVYVRSGMLPPTRQAFSPRGRGCPGRGGCFGRAFNVRIHLMPLTV